MATSGRGSGMVGYNVQAAVDTKHHLIVAHEVTNVGTDRSQLSAMAKQTKAALETEALDVVTDRGTFSGKEILACEKAGITGHASQTAHLGQQGPQGREGAGLASRTSSTWPMRMSIGARPASAWSTASRTRRTD